MRTTLLLLILLLAGLPAISAAKKKKRTRRARKIQRISLSVKSADIRDVLTFLARQARINIIMHHAVRGRITLYWERIRLDRAFNAVLRSQQLTTIRSGNVYLILPATVYLKLLRTRLKNRTLQHKLRFLGPPKIVR